jgi:hypothetical protein
MLLQLTDSEGDLIDERQSQVVNNAKLIDWSGLQDAVDALPSEGHWIL